MHAGTWRGLEVAIKTVLFECAHGEAPAAAVNECKIASDLVHGNVVATYSHRLRPVRDAGGDNEIAIFKMYLVQARTLPRSLRGVSTCRGLLMLLSECLLHVSCRRSCMDERPSARAFVPCRLVACVAVALLLSDKNLRKLRASSDMLSAICGQTRFEHGS